VSWLHRRELPPSAYLVALGFCTLLLLMAIVLSALVSADGVIRQTQINRGNGNNTRALICMLVQHDHLDGGRLCPAHSS
jgi:hypothetical protein